ncbi:MAG: biotin/lipoyl-containing protein [Sulfolobaceae archaeon]
MLRTIEVPRDIWPRRTDWVGEVVKVYVKEGEFIRVNDIVAEIEIEKVILRIESPYSGKVIKVYVKEGDIVKPGTPIIEVEE